MFRALTKDTRREARGGHCEIEDKHYIILDDAEIEIHGTDEVIIGFVEIDPTTLGLETGQLDKNKVMIVGGWGPGIEKGGDDVKRNCKETYSDQEHIDRFDGAIGIVRYNTWRLGFFIDLISKHDEWSFNGPEGPNWHPDEIEITGWKAKA